MSGGRIVRVPFREQVGDAYRLWFSLGLIVTASVIAGLLPVARGLAAAIVCGAVGGVVGHWRATVPATITTDARLADDARQWFSRRGYAAHADGDELVPKLPRALRFNSQNVRFVHERGGALTIVAPWYLLKAYVRAAGLRG